MAYALPGAQSDAALAEGNLPRPELEAGLVELRMNMFDGKLK